MTMKILHPILIVCAITMVSFYFRMANADQLKVVFMCPEPVEVKNGAVIGDYGWNQMGAEGALEACRNTGSKCEIASGLGYADIRPILREYAATGVSMIIAHASGYNSAAAEIAKEFRVPVAVTELPNSSTPGLVTNYELSGAPGAYLAGVLAANMTRTGSLGIVVSSEVITWNLQAGGFVQGARSVNPKINIHYAVIGHMAYEDVAGANRVTKSVIGAGADIIYGMGNGATFGMLQATETTKAKDGGKVWFIDVIGDKRQIDKGHLLSSTAWNLAPIWTAMIKDIKSGSFGTNSYDLSLSDNSVNLLKTKYIPEDIWQKVVTARDGILSGKITVAEVAEIEELKSMMSTVDNPQN